jgi:hypothetical protein
LGISNIEWNSDDGMVILTKTVFERRKGYINFCFKKIENSNSY